MLRLVRQRTAVQNGTLVQLGQHFCLLSMRELIRLSSSALGLMALGKSPLVPLQQEPPQLVWLPPHSGGLPLHLPLLHHRPRCPSSELQPLVLAAPPAVLSPPVRYRPLSPRALLADLALAIRAQHLCRRRRPRALHLPPPCLVARRWLLLLLTPRVTDVTIQQPPCHQAVPPAALEVPPGACHLRSSLLVPLLHRCLLLLVLLRPLLLQEPPPPGSAAAFSAAGKGCPALF